MNKPERLILTHETVGGDGDYLQDYIIIIESLNRKVVRVYHTLRPSWHKYYDTVYRYNPINLN